MGVRSAFLAAIAVVAIAGLVCIFSIRREVEVDGASLSQLKLDELINMARDGNVEERMMAAIELSRRSSKWAMMALIERVRFDRAEAVRIVAIKGLIGRYEDVVDDAMLTVLRELQSRTPTEAKLAVEHLRDSPSEATWRKLIELYFSMPSGEIDNYAQRLFSHLNKASLRPICQMLGTGVAFKETNNNVSMQLGHKQRQLLTLIESVPMDELIPLLSDNDIAVVVGALQLLVKFPTDNAAPKLVELVGSKHRIIRALASSALALKPSKTVANELKRLAKANPDRYVRACATVALSTIGEAEFKEVDRLLQSQDPIERKLALHALSNMRLPCKAMIERLYNLIDDEDKEIRLTASVMLLQCGEDGLMLFLKALERAHSDERASMLLALKGIKHKGALKAIITSLTSSEPQVRWAAGVALSSHGENALPMLRNLLKHSDENVRMGALSALMQIGGAEAARLISDTALNDDSKLVRIQAIEALAAFPSERQAIEALQRLLEGQDDELATKAALALGKTGLSGLKALKGTLRSKNKVARLAAARVLALYGDDESIKQLRDIASSTDDEIMELAALQALVRAGDMSAAKKLIGMLSSDDEAKRMRVRAAILGAGAAMIEPLKEALNDKDERIRNEASLLLPQLSPQLTRP